jgi:Flp pilus assembly pilin Flp
MKVTHEVVFQSKSKDSGRARKRMSGERGFSLLEYCAGAAVILVTIWGALSLMGDNIETLLNSIGNWATTRAGEINGESN